MIGDLSRRALIGTVAAVATAATVPAWAQQRPARLALVIGNSDYRDVAVNPLTCAELDAPKIAQRLESLRFKVDCQVNLDEAALRKAVAAFGERLRAAGPEAVSFVYYAGHAAQDPQQINYLIPVDASTGKAEDVWRKGTPVDRFLEAYEAANNPVNVLVIDACRDWFANDTRASRTRGLYEIKRRGNVGIAMATGPGMTAADGSGESSPYSARLIKALEEQAQESLAEMFDDINFKVRLDTDGGQQPDYLNSLSRVRRWSLGRYEAPSTIAAAQPPIAPFIRTNEFLRTIDRSKLVVFMSGRESIVDALLSRRDLFAQAEIDTPKRLTHFLGEIAYQTNGFSRFEESLNYSVAGLMATFSRRRISKEMAEELGRKPGQGPTPYPDRIANIVYANMAGNGDAASGDGWRYRGRGYLQITGRGNYRMIGRLVGVDLEGEPELLNDPEVNLAVAIRRWSKSGANSAADAGDLQMIARKIDGGPRGLEYRRKWLAAAEQALGIVPA